MELPHLGEHCSEKACNTLDFLPFKCDACQKIFCKDHYNYLKHSCNSFSARNRDFQVPLCPLCNQPVPYKRNELPDIMMSAHIDRDCKSDPAEDRRRKIYSNQCFKKGCKKRELLPFECTRCRENYCIRHRNEIDHECIEIPKTGENKEINSKRLFNIFQRQQASQSTNQARSVTNQTRPVTNQTRPVTNQTRPSQSRYSAQPNTMSESEALEHAIKLSLQDNTIPTQANNSSNRPETEEEILARVLAQSEREYERQQGLNDKKDGACSIG